MSVLFSVLHLNKNTIIDRKFILLQNDNLYTTGFSFSTYIQFGPTRNYLPSFSSLPSFLPKQHLSFAKLLPCQSVNSLPMGQLHLGVC